MKGIFGGIRVILGKPSKGCKGFGACEVTIGVTFYDHTNHKLASNQAMALWVENNDGDFAKLELEAPISGPTDFIVEQDVIDYNAGYYIPAGTYSLNSTIGSYGGYLLPLQEL